MWRQESAIELHAFDDVDVSLVAAAFFNRDHAVFADFKKGFSQNVADRWIVVARDGGDLLDFFLALAVNRLSNPLEFGADGTGGFLDAT